MTRSTTPTPTVLWAAVALIALLAILPGCFFDVPEAPEAVAAEDCARFVGPFDDPNSLKLGAIFALSGPSPELGLRSLNALRLATDQINNFGGVGGLQNARPLAFQVCDDKGDPDQAVLVASYLADTLFPPAIVGPAQSRSVLPVADSVTIPSGIVQISGSATAVDISALDDDDLVWRTAPPDTDQPNALAYFAYWQLLRASATSGNNNTRVGLVNSNDAYGQGFASTFRTSLEATASVSSLVTIEFVSISYDASDAEAVQAAGEELVQESPLDAVLLVGFEETADILAFSTTEAGAVLRETAFFMPDGARSSRLRTLFSSESEKPALLFGVNPAFRSGDTFDQFATAYTEAFATTPDSWTEHVYDAVYLLAIACAGIEGEPLGFEIAEQLQRMNEPTGRAVRFVPGDLVAAFNEMSVGGSLDVEGASGPLDFDNDVGEPLTAGILRWDVIPGEQTIQECGVSSIYYADGRAPERLWCNALCLGDDPSGCVPDNAP